MDFILDGTGTIQNYGGTSTTGKLSKNISSPNPNKTDFVEKQIETLLKVVYRMEGESHRPRYCEIYWGALLFRGVLSNIDVNYTLFHPNGKPLRAKVSASFVQSIHCEERERRQNKKSPDLTRIRQLKGGDRLESMVYEFYNNSNLILQIAKANNLTGFRKIKTGAELRFPPIDKTEVL